MAEPKYTNKLKGTRVLIVGGTSGLGYGVAEALLEHSAAHIIISSSNPTRVKDTISTLKKSYPNASTKIDGFPCNLGDEATLEQNIKELFEKLPLEGQKLDHVVYTAGDSLATKKLAEVDFAFIKKAGMVRFFAPLLVAKQAANYLNASAASSFTLTTGGVAEHPIPDWTVVGSYATGLMGMARSLALDLKPIRVNAISPGAVDTQLWKGMSEEQKEKMFEGLKSTMTTGGIGQVVDVVESYLYVMKDKNVSGSVISTNGGHLVM